MTNIKKSQTDSSSNLQPSPSLPTADCGINPRFRTAYGPKLKTPISFPTEGKAKQSFKDECDINHIMARYQNTGVLEHINTRPPSYADTVGMDYQAAMETIAAAQSLFQQLPSSVRARFENNPGKFVDFCENPENLPELHKMGLARPDYDPKGVDIKSAAPTQPAPLPVAPGPLPEATIPPVKP